ncbi:MAG: methyltransferase domain-containing protein [Candidatus Marinimicrobia bacterium]|nr:methyltransferase domain-containing protein [Candidatus Neomarinimicrobiota bacterium]
MDKKLFNKIRKIVYDKSGINISEKKEALVSSRTRKRMRKLNIDDYQEYFDYLKQDESGKELVKFLDVISTNVTHFFRESEHFDFLADQFRKGIQQGQKKFRFWSAACSSGEEPYSMAMTLLEALNGESIDFKILGTDISTAVLANAMNGLYVEKKMNKIDKKLLKKYFIEENNGSLKKYRASNKLKRLILFRRLNLSEIPFPIKSKMDIIFCRNVMIYFDQYHRSRLLKELYRLLKPGGYLITGHSESITGINRNFEVVRPSIYYKKRY